MPRLASALLTLFVLLLAAPQALAGEVIDRAVSGLRDDPVYIDPDAEPTIDGAAADRLRDRIAEAGAGGIYVAVLPRAARNEAGGDTIEIARAIAQGLGREGTFAVVAGGQFRAGATNRRGVGRLADEAYAAAGSRGVGPTLEAFVQRVGDSGATGGGGAGNGNGNGTDATGLLVVLGVLGAGGGMLAWRRARRRRHVQAAQVADLHRAAHDDLVALGDDVRAVDIDIEMPNAPPAARDALGRGLAAYEEAETALDQARTPEAFGPITRRIGEGRQAMAECRALLEGREPPAPRPMCFFDPRHGPSTTEAEWAPAGYAPRPVPVCAACEVRLLEGLEPDSREIESAGERMPYWNAPSHFGPYAGGFFGGGMLLPGLLFGSLLGSAMAPPMAYGDSGDAGGGDSFGGGGGGGDFGGGGFGGGDFGGGDFGGGDF